MTYARDPDTRLAPASLQKIHPLGKSPVVSDDGVVYAESGAILEHLVDKYGAGKLAPTAGTPAHARYRYFMHYAEGSLMPFLLLRFICARIRIKAPLLIRPVARAIAGRLEAQYVAPNVARHVAFLGDELAKSPWFCGDELTAADIQMSYPMEAIAARVADPPKPIVDWVERAHARPAYQRALARGGAYTIEV